jgi:hypothetical protein
MNFEQLDLFVYATITFLPALTGQMLQNIYIQLQKQS